MPRANPHRADLWRLVVMILCCVTALILAGRVLVGTLPITADVAPGRAKWVTIEAAGIAVLALVGGIVAARRLIRGSRISRGWIAVYCLAAAALSALVVLIH